ncbi:MAG: Preprotein translocase subunit SecF [Alphaproteobacteria bacterium]|jgi:preprotein translocase SecF subunit|nr:Preprotein translocase subunit SecF [Alphaproteobacteria bacterium]
MALFRPLRLIPHGTKFNFMRPRLFALALSTFMNIASIVLVFTVGFNLGIDFKGGVLLEVQTPGKADLAAIRETIGKLDLGDVALQEFGQDNVVLIRVQRQEAGQACFANAINVANKTAGSGYSLRDVKLDGANAQVRIATPQPLTGQSVTALAGAMGLPSERMLRAEEGGGIIAMERTQAAEWCQQVAIKTVEAALGEGYVERRTESVGPKVGSELVQTGLIAGVVTIAGILIYIWFRFEWQFAVGALIALAHDVLTTLGLFALTQIEFNLASLAAVLTIAGYSVNDTVVVFDRVRENMRKFKKMPLIDLLNLSLNDTLSRTIMTAGTTFLAVLALVLLGGPVIQGFSVAMLWGVIVGTYSSIWMACAMLVYTGVRDGSSIIKDEHDKAQAEFAAKP